MPPVPHRVAVHAFAGGCLCLLLGISLASVPSVALGSGVLFVLAVAFGLSVPTAHRMRRQRPELKWNVNTQTRDRNQSQRASVVAGVPFGIQCCIEQRGPTELVLENVEPALPTHLSWRPAETSIVRIPTRSQTHVSFSMVAPATGRLVLPGLTLFLRAPLGLFLVPLYVAKPFSFCVLPRSVSFLHQRLAHRQPPDSAILGYSNLRRRGGGTDLHELRALVPGDPFKSIAWKASARRGKLIVREVEDETQETHWTVLDIGETMREGRPGFRCLDRGIELAASDAQRSLAAGHRAGLLTVDDCVLKETSPRDGSAQRLRIYEGLLAATAVVDAVQMEQKRAKALGVSEALRIAGADRQHPVSIVVITDFGGMQDTEPLTRAIRFVRSHRHTLVFVLPDESSVAEEHRPAADPMLRTIQQRSALRRATEARRVLGRLGIPVVWVAPSRGQRANLHRIASSERSSP